MGTTRRTQVATVGALLAAGLALTGCTASAGDASMDGMHHDGAAPSASAEAASAADVMFVTMMIPHHEQAVEMTTTVLAKEGVDERVQALAERIRDAQAPEIALMRGWLANWSVAAPTTGDAMSHGDGMMSDEDMTALEAADGGAAGRLFVEQMIQHHEGAVAMAEAEAADGSDADVLALAREVATSQTAEITEMTELLAQL